MHLCGLDIEQALISKNDFSINMMDALVRLYMQMDEIMYRNWAEKRWRHFLPTEFAVSWLCAMLYYNSNTDLLYILS